MITSAKKMHDNLEIQNLKRSILAVGKEELEIWKRAVVADEQLFSQLFQLIFSGDKRLAWRSCWIIDNASEYAPGLLADKLPKIIAGFLTTTDGSLKRHFTRMLCRYQIPEENLGEIVNRAFKLLAPSEPISVRVFAMQLLFNISLRLPDLKGELTSVLENLVDEGGSAGFINRSGKLLRKLRS